MITHTQRAELKEKIRELLRAHEHLTGCVSAGDTHAANNAGSECNRLEDQLNFWIDKEL